MVREQRAKIPKPDWRRKLDGGFENIFLQGDEANEIDDLLVYLPSNDEAALTETQENVKKLIVGYLWC